MVAAPASGSPGNAPKSSPLKPASAPLKPASSPLKPASSPIAPASVPLKAGAAKAAVISKDGAKDGAEAGGDSGLVASGSEPMPKSAPLSPAVAKPPKTASVAESSLDESDSESESVSGMDKLLAFAALLVAALSLLSTFLTYSVLKS
jgi:hypothetical protein